jgi:hypothetical protein
VQRLGVGLTAIAAEIDERAAVDKENNEIGFRRARQRRTTEQTQKL